MGKWCGPEGRSFESVKKSWLYCVLLAALSQSLGIPILSLGYVSMFHPDLRSVRERCGFCQLKSWIENTSF